MSLYEMLFPDPNRAQRLEMLSPMAGLHIPRVPRVRDAWPEHSDIGGVHVRVLTRIGGSNRQHYTRSITALREVPTFLRDADEEEWDPTYASFWYRLADDLPDEAVAALRSNALPPVSMATMAAGAMHVAQQRWARDEFTAEELLLRDQLDALARGEGPPDGVIRV